MVIELIYEIETDTENRFVVAMGKRVGWTGVWD